MIFVRDKGRMCNNILQFGHVYAWARKHNRNCMSMRFAYKYQYFHICHTRWHNFLTYAAAKYAAKMGLLPVAGFHTVGDNPEAQQLLESRKNHVVEGWEVRFYDLFLSDYIIGAPSTFSLVAAMYHDRPLAWIMSADGELTFDKFDNLFKRII